MSAIPVQWRNTLCLNRLKGSLIPFKIKKIYGTGISQNTVEELKEYHNECKISRIKIGDLWESGDRHYIFHVGFGKPIYHSSPTHWWRKFINRHSLKPIRFHDLRHSTASILIQNDVSMKAIQERLGHSKHQTTADLYAHVAQSVSRAAADKLEKLYPRKKLPSTVRQQGLF